MKNFLEFLLLHLVSNPDAIEITQEEQEDYTEFIIKVHPEDIGRIIGRQGRTIQAIRTLAKVRAIQDDIRVRITIDDSEGVKPEETDDALEASTDESAEVPEVFEALEAPSEE